MTEPIQTKNEIRFADPYKVCNACHAWVDGVIQASGPDAMIPCGHRNSYESVCPSWGPVDGCTCEATLGYRPHALRWVPATSSPPEVGYGL